MLKNPNNDKRIKVNINSARPSDCTISLYDNNGNVGNLGLIQSFTINGRVGEFNRITIECLIEDGKIDFPSDIGEIRVIHQTFWSFIKTKFKQIFKL